MSNSLRPSLRATGKRIACIATMLACLVALSSETLSGESTQWWKDAGVQQRLQLTANQVAAIEAVFRRSLPERKLLRSRLDELETRLASIMATVRVDESAAFATIEAVEQARARRNIARSLMVLEMYGILTPIQRAALTRPPAGPR